MHKRGLQLCTVCLEPVVSSFDSSLNFDEFVTNEHVRVYFANNIVVDGALCKLRPRKFVWLCGKCQETVQYSKGSTVLQSISRGRGMLKFLALRELGC